VRHLFVKDVGYVDLAEVVEMWQMKDDYWKVRFRNAGGEPLRYDHTVGTKVFAALKAYREGQP
jgi:hypothetical protein